MINFDFEKKCYGCRNCENICPVDAIKMIENAEGFLIPIIDKNRCIKCGICEKKCPYIEYKKNDKIEERAWYSCYLKDECEREKSASGGVSSALANWIVENGGYVCGCVWDDKINAVHIVTNKKNELEKMRGSKYVQSDLKKCAKEIKNLVEKYKVLFTGTPCQVAAIKRYIGEHENLYSAAVICEGVPSNKVWKKYIQRIEEKQSCKLNNVIFRGKDIGWEPPVIKYEFTNGTIKKNLTLTSDRYGVAFLQGLYYRNSCYNCQYKLDGYNADIIMGDFWGADKKRISESKNKGISVIMSNSSKGKYLLENVENSLVLEKIEQDVALKKNPMIFKSMEWHENRERFYKEIDKLDIIKNINKNIKMTSKKKIKNIIKTMAFKTRTYNFIRKIIK